jgi:hypothetical protein
MKKELQKENKLTSKDISDKMITRKEAIRKTGYIALSAATMMLLLNSQAKASSSPAPIDPWKT